MKIWYQSASAYRYEPVWDDYGQTLEAQCRRILHPETGLDTPDGEPGILRIHDLANVWSVAALDTSDLGRRHGQSFELLGRAAEAEPRGCSRMTL